MNIQIKDSTMKDLELNAEELSMMVVALLEYKDNHDSEKARNVLKKFNVHVNNLK